MSDTKTPRTDKQVAAMDARHYLWTKMGWELVEVARGIERDLNAVRENMRDMLRIADAGEVGTDEQIATWRKAAGGAE